MLINKYKNVNGLRSVVIVHLANVIADTLRTVVIVHLANVMDYVAW
jgi:hypothetical protein